MKEFGALQENVRELSAQRLAVLRIFVLSRNATTQQAQREYWREFTWVDQEYRVAVQRLARFCEAQEHGLQRQPRPPPGSRTLNFAR
jgi:hypothetical protein